MDVFSVQDLRTRTDALIQGAKAGKLALITNKDQPVLLAVPFSEDLLKLGLRTTLAISLFKEDVLTLEKASKLADQSLEEFMGNLGNLGISVVNYPPAELDEELKNFE